MTAPTTAVLSEDQVAAMTEPQLIALRDLLDRLISLAVALERTGGG